MSARSISNGVSRTSLAASGCGAANRARKALLSLLLGAAGAGALAGCTTVTLQGGDKPIEVNLNVKIDQEVRVKLDREIEDLIAENPDIF